MKGNQKSLSTIAADLSGPLSTANGQADPAKLSTHGNRQEWLTPHGLTGGQGQQGGEFDKQVRWATPSGDYANNATRDSGQFQSLTRQAGKLNPHWVLCLMGYPPLWAELGRRWVKPGFRRVNKKTLRREKRPCTTA